MSLIILVIICIAHFDYIHTSPTPTVDDIIDLTPYGDKLFGHPQLSSGDALSNWDPATSKVNPEETGEYFEGDILFPLGPGRNGIRPESFRWANAIVPYVIAPTFNPGEFITIFSAMEAYAQNTCIKFVPRTIERDYVYIVNNSTGCWSSVGRLGGRQFINLQSNGCLYGMGTAIHEMNHAIGFFHEQSRRDRDAYVTINYANIEPSKTYNFDIFTPESIDNFDTKYDYGSIVHYSANAFSINGLPTIVPKEPGAVIGQRLGLSPIDIQQISNMYKCPSAGWWFFRYVKNLVGL